MEIEDKYLKIKKCEQNKKENKIKCLQDKKPNVHIKQNKEIEMTFKPNN